MITPCVGLCNIDETTQVCFGCKRTKEEIESWGDYSEVDRLKIMYRLGYGKRMGRQERLRRYEKG